MEEVLYAALEAAITKGHQVLWTVVKAVDHRPPSLVA
jgi:hypothetical protein